METENIHGHSSFATNFSRSIIIEIPTGRANPALKNSI